MKLQDGFYEFMEKWPDAIRLPLKGNSLAKYFIDEVGRSVSHDVEKYSYGYKVEASVGKGGWANIPWISILNPKITSSTQKGVYPVFLFRSDGEGVYLCIMPGTTGLKERYSGKEYKLQVNRVISSIREKLPRLETWESVPKINLQTTSTRGKSYEESCIAAKYYSKETLLSACTIDEDFKNLLEIYSELDDADFMVGSKISELISSCNNDCSVDVRLSKPFILLAGISGTGKTRFVRDQSENTGTLDETYCLTSVRPDWHEPSDLLGYISRLQSEPVFVVTEVLVFIAKAWREIFSSGVEFYKDENGNLKIKGEKSRLNSIKPYWLCLDEMNLAPVEQYFSDYLSVLETRQWTWSGESFSYTTDALLSSSTIRQLGESTTLRKDLGFQDDSYNEVWEVLKNNGMGIPFNLIVAGTVNMDETTHGFSRKVIDRALSFDFGVFFPNDYSQFFTPTNRNKNLSYPIWSQASELDLSSTYDTDGKKTIAFLTAINFVLKGTPFELAYRALNELLLSVISSQPQDEETLLAVWDDFLMCKVLPRVEGDSDKLTTIDGNNMLVELSGVLAKQLEKICKTDKESLVNQRPDLYREKIIDSNKVVAERSLKIDCRSIAKLAWMQQRLSSTTFTSFWP